MRGEGALFLTASFGCMIPSRILELYEAGHTLNVHPSLLPQYRGAAPIQWAIANGETESGVTVQELSMGKFDRGRILAQHPLVSSAAHASITYKLIQYAAARRRCILRDDRSELR